MSQEKVDRYKEQKANRQKIMKKEKREKLMWKIGGYAVVLLLVIWVGYSAFDRFYEAPVRYYDADVTALGDYLNGLSAEEETESENVTEAGGDAAEAAEDATEAAEDATEAVEDTTEAAEDATEAAEDVTEAGESATEA